MNIENICCPLCHHKNSINLGKSENKNIFKCLNCSVQYVYPMPTTEDLNKFYNSSYNVIMSKYMQIYNKKNINGFKKSIKKIKNEINKKFNNINLIEFGSSKGLFLDLVVKMGWKVVGVELDDSARVNCEKRLNIKTYKSLDRIIELDLKFDIAVSWHTIEHLLEPGKEILKLNNCLNKEGLLFLTTPNVNSFASRINALSWEWIDTSAHIFYFSPQSITNLLQNNGFQVLKVITQRGEARNLALELIIGLIKRSKLNQWFRRKMTYEKLELQNIRNNPETPPVDRTSIKYRVFWYLSNIIYLFIYPFDLMLRKLNLGEELFVVAKKIV